MRRVWFGMGLLSVLIGQFGCENDAILRPPKNPEEFNQPPQEQRYLLPQDLPKEYLNEDILKNKKGGDQGGPGGPGGGSRLGRTGGGI